MAEIPPDIAGSAAQAGFQARDVSKLRDARRAAPAQAAREQAQAADEAAATVDTNDTDNQVFADAEGAGSQGRTHDDQTHDQDADTPAADAGITRDEDGRLHIDLEA
ncbi:MAG: hypothetical protein ACE5E6_06415 [Phycisphaerae bacterium]